MEPVTQPANIQIASHNSVYTGGFFDQHVVISGWVSNTGGSVSNPIIIGITITDPEGNILYTGSTYPQPSILQPREEAPFTKAIYPNEMGGYAGQWYYQLTVQSQ